MKKTCNKKALLQNNLLCTQQPSQGMMTKKWEWYIGKYSEQSARPPLWEGLRRASGKFNHNNFFLFTTALVTFSKPHHIHRILKKSPHSSHFIFFTDLSHSQEKHHILKKAPRSPHSQNIIKFIIFFKKITTFIKSNSQHFFASNKTKSSVDCTEKVILKKDHKNFSHKNVMHLHFPK